MKTILGLFAILFLVIIVTVASLHGQNLSFLPKAQTVQIDGHLFTVELAKTQQQQQQGLSGRKNLANDHGMLFLFSQPDYARFWMRDMQFPLDIIFIENNKIVTIYQNVPYPQPKTPETSLPIYVSTSPTDKVLEVNAGTVKKDNIHVGDIAIFSL